VEIPNEDTSMLGEDSAQKDKTPRTAGQQARREEMIAKLKELKSERGDKQMAEEIAKIAADEAVKAYEIAKSATKEVRDRINRLHDQLKAQQFEE
jgi:hypothetical protein